MLLASWVDSHGGKGARTSGMSGTSPTKTPSHTCASLYVEMHMLHTKLHLYADWMGMFRCWQLLDSTASNKINHTASICLNITFSASSSAILEWHSLSHPHPSLVPVSITTSLPHSRGACMLLSPIYKEKLISPLETYSQATFSFSEIGLRISLLP